MTARATPKGSTGDVRYKIGASVEQVAARHPVHSTVAPAPVGRLVVPPERPRTRRRRSESFSGGPANTKP